MICVDYIRINLWISTDYMFQKETNIVTYLFTYWKKKQDFN